MENKVVYEVRLSKPVMTVAIMAAVGLLAIGAKPLIEATPAFAQSNQIYRVAICDPYPVFGSGNNDCLEVGFNRGLKFESR